MLSALNIWSRFRDRRAQQEKEVKENSKHPPMVWDIRERSGWGNSVSFINWDKRKLVGWTTPLPSVGDEVLSAMQSGRVGRFKITSVEPSYDPSDMWFAQVDDIGYLE